MHIDLPQEECSLSHPVGDININKIIIKPRVESKVVGKIKSQTFSFAR